MVSKFDRRTLLAGGAAAAAGMAGASAMGSGWDTLAGAVTNGPGRNGVTKQTPKKGGSLTFGVDAEEQGFDPTQARFDEVGVMYARTVFDPLTIVLANGDWAPYLAESVVPNASYTTWTVTLRPNLVFHDGTPCNGAALLANFEAHAKSLLTGVVINPTLQSITQTGPLSVAISFKSPWAPFPYYLAGGIGGQIAYVVAPSMLANPNGTSHPVGTGPFVFKEWIPNDHFTATANPSYWRPGCRYLSQITFKPIPDEAARAEALKSGTIDLLVTDTPQLIVQFRGNRSYSYIDDSTHLAGEPDMNCVQLNCLATKPFNNPSLRRAAAMAINRNQYARVIDQNVLPVSNGLFVPGSPYYSTTSYPAYNPTQAKSLVQQAARQNGGPISFTLAGDQLTGGRPGAGVPPAGLPVGRLPGEGDHLRAEPAHQQRAGGCVRGDRLAPVRGGGPGPQLHLLEHDDGHRRVVHQHGPQRRLDDRDGAPGRARQHPGQHQGGCLQDGQQTSRPRSPVPVDGPGGLGDRRAPRRCRTSTTRPRRRASRPLA